GSERDPTLIAGVFAFELQESVTEEQAIHLAQQTTDLLSHLRYTPLGRGRSGASIGPWLLLDSRVVGFADVIQPNCCHPFLLEALLFQWPKKGVVLLGQCLEHKPPESNKSADGMW